MSVTPATRGRGRVSERNTSLIFTKIEIKEKCLKQIRRRASRANVNLTLAGKRQVRVLIKKVNSTLSEREGNRICLDNEFLLALSFSRISRRE